MLFFQIKIVLQLFQNRKVYHYVTENVLTKANIFLEYCYKIFTTLFFHYRNVLMIFDFCAYFSKIIIHSKNHSIILHIYLYWCYY